ncbi:hypothetical protein Ttaiw_01307 [Tepidimonas taiwanensis]|uniref:Uncharacterized protein n=1 Tax=Tepidimonas taiwanensis TaxID=307486 RepID=A0A554X7U6_9BURK|nr:hypothetical protein Ttaiw_01307 [Tepidimonas taiwanensis]
MPPIGQCLCERFGSRKEGWQLGALPAKLVLPMGFSHDSENEKGTTGRCFDGASQRAPKLWLPPQL